MYEYHDTQAGRSSFLLFCTFFLSREIDDFATSEVVSSSTFLSPNLYSSFNLRTNARRASCGPGQSYLDITILPPGPQRSPNSLFLRALDEEKGAHFSAENVRGRNSDKKFTAKTNQKNLDKVPRETRLRGEKRGVKVAVPSSVSPPQTPSSEPSHTALTTTTSPSPRKVLPTTPSPHNKPAEAAPIRPPPAPRPDPQPTAHTPPPTTFQKRLPPSPPKNPGLELTELNRKARRNAGGGQAAGRLRGGVPASLAPRSRPRPRRRRVGRGTAAARRSFPRSPTSPLPVPAGRRRWGRGGEGRGGGPGELTDWSKRCGGVQAD